MVRNQHLSITLSSNSWWWQKNYEIGEAVQILMKLNLAIYPPHFLLASFWLSIEPKLDQLHINDLGKGAIFAWLHKFGSALYHNAYSWHPLISNWAKIGSNINDIGKGAISARLHKIAGALTVLSREKPSMSLTQNFFACLKIDSHRSHRQRHHNKLFLVNVMMDLHWWWW